MAEKKISTVALKVDLECTRCYKKISKAICKIQVKENIRTIIFDEKTNTVTISGPFDPKKVIKKLCCNACEVIKDIQIKNEKVKEKPKDAKPVTEPVKDKPKDAKPDVEPAKDKPKDEPKKDKPNGAKPADEPKKDKPNGAKPADEPKKDKPKDAKPAAEPAKDKSKDAKPAAEPAKDKSKDDKSTVKPKDAKLADEPKKDKPKDAKPDAEPVEDKSKDAEPQKDKPKALESYLPATEPGFVLVHEPRLGYQPVWGGPVCGCGGPQYGGYYGNNRGCWCGKGSGWTPCGPMGPSGPPPIVYGQPVCGRYAAHNYFSEEDAESCNIM